MARFNMTGWKSLPPRNRNGIVGPGIDQILGQYGQQVTPQAPSGINRSGPATPPTIPIPTNQNQMAGGYYSQLAQALSGVPGIGGQPMYPTPNIGQIAQRNMGGAINGIDPQMIAQLYLAKTNPLMRALYGLK